MFRLLLLIAIGYFVYRLLTRKTPQIKREARGSTASNAPVQELVQDPVTKTYLPRDEAIKYQGQFFASQESLEIFKGSRDGN